MKNKMVVTAGKMMIESIVLNDIKLEGVTALSVSVDTDCQRMKRVTLTLLVEDFEWSTVDTNIPEEIVEAVHKGLAQGGYVNWVSGEGKK